MLSNRNVIYFDIYDADDLLHRVGINKKDNVIFLQQKGPGEKRFTTFRYTIKQDPVREFVDFCWKHFWSRSTFCIGVIIMSNKRKTNVIDDHGVEIYEGDLVYMFIDGLGQIFGKVSIDRDGEAYIVTDDNKCYLLMNPCCNYSRNKKCRET